MSEVEEDSDGGGAAPPEAMAAEAVCVVAVCVCGGPRERTHPRPLRYIDDIFRHLRQTEGRYGPSAGYMRKQSDINEKMRAILIDWFVDVHLKFRLVPETLYLSVNLLDRFLEMFEVQRGKLQLVGIAAMFIASKYEETFPPKASDFVHVTNKAYTQDALRAMEKTMLHALDFKVTVPTQHSFLVRFVKVACASSKTEQLADFYSECCLLEYAMLKYLPSVVAASAVYIAQRAMASSPAWTPALIRHTTFTEATIQPCVKDMLKVLENAKISSLQAVRKKYTREKFLEVALVPLPSEESIFHAE